MGGWVSKWLRDWERCLLCLLTGGDGWKHAHFEHEGTFHNTSTHSKNARE